MISNIIGLSPELTFFLLLTTTSLSLMFSMKMIEHSWNNKFRDFVLSFISAFVFINLLVYMFINFFCWSITIL